MMLAEMGDFMGHYKSQLRLVHDLSQQTHINEYDAVLQ